LELVEILENFRGLDFFSEVLIHVGEPRSDALVTRVRLKVWVLLAKQVIQSIVISWGVSNWSVLVLSFD